MIAHILSSSVLSEKQLSWALVLIGTFVLSLVFLSLISEDGKKSPPVPNFGLPRIGDAAAFLKDPVKLLFANLIYLRGTRYNRMYTDVREDTWSFGGGIGLFLRKIAQPGYFDHFRTLVSSLNRGVNRKVALDHYTQLVEEEADKVLEIWSQQDRVQIFEETSRFVHRVIVRCLMGQDFYENHLDELYDILHHMETDIGHPLNMLLPDWVPHPPSRRLQQHRDRYGRIFQQQLAERRKDPQAWKDSLDYISFTLEDPRTAHLDDWLPSHHTVMMFAAHTSTVASIAWTIIELLRNPEYISEVRKALDAHDMDARHTPELLACIKESGRHYSGVHMFRTTHRPVDLDEGRYTVPPNWIVCVSPYLTHHDPEIYHDPHKWLPGRWLGHDSSTRNLNNPQEVAFMQFGAGCHRCPGEALAGIIAQGMVSHLLKNYDLALENDVPSQDLSMLDFSKVGSPWLLGDAFIRLSRREE